MHPLPLSNIEHERAEKKKKKKKIREKDTKNRRITRSRRSIRLVQEDPRPLNPFLVHFSSIGGSWAHATLVRSDAETFNRAHHHRGSHQLKRRRRRRNGYRDREILVDRLQPDVFRFLLYIYIIQTEVCLSIVPVAYIPRGQREGESDINCEKRKEELELEEYCSVDGGDVETDLTVLDWILIKWRINFNESIPRFWYKLFSRTIIIVITPSKSRKQAEIIICTIQTNVWANTEKWRANNPCLYKPTVIGL